MSGRLVILGSTLTALAVVRDAHAHGLEAVVVDNQDDAAFQSRWCVPRRLAAGTAPDAALNAVRELGGPDSWLVATGDQWVRFVAEHRAQLDGSYRRVLHPSNEVLAICLNKHRFAAWCAANKLSAPLSWFVGSGTRPADLRQPFLIRPAETLHGRNTAGLPKAVEANDEAMLEHWLRLYAENECPVLVSESLLGQALTQYSVPFARAGGVLESFVARKVRPAPERCAVGTCVELSPQADVEALGRAAADKLDYLGVGEAEILHVPATGRSYLIEINARPWLQYALAPASGHDFLGLVTGRPQVSRAQVKQGRCWIDFRADIFQAFSSSVGAVRRGELGLGAYLRSLSRVNVFARFHPSDMRPAFAREE